MIVLLFVVFGQFADGVEYAVVGFGECPAAARHHAVSDVEELLHRKIGESGGATFAVKPWKRQGLILMRRSFLVLRQ